MKNLRKVISVVLILSIVLSLFGGCSINDVEQFTVEIDGDSQAMQALGKGDVVDDVNNLEVVLNNLEVICPLNSTVSKTFLVGSTVELVAGDRSFSDCIWRVNGNSFEPTIHPYYYNYQQRGSKLYSQGVLFADFYSLGSYVVTFSDDFYRFYTFNIEIVASTPSITVPTQPTDRTMFETENRSVSVGANVSAGTLSYQWYDNNVAISGATSADYNLSTLTVGEHKLKCKLSAPDAVDVYTTEATITVLPKPKLLITDQPKSLNMVIGENKSVNVVATVQNGMGEIHYQWYDGDTLIVGATSATYNLSTLSVGTHLLKCKISSANADEIITNLSTVVVAAQPIITINTQPTAKEFFVGETVSVNVGATIANKVTEISYQWFDGTTAIANATTSTLDVSSLTVGTHQITCELTSDFADKKTTTVVTVTVKSKPILSFTTQPIAKEFFLGDVQNLTVVANLTNSTSPIVYKWYNGANVIANANTATLDLSGLAVGTYQIKCEISSANAVTVTSNVVNVIVKKRPIITITKQPESKTIVVGDNASITVTATVSAENSPLSYQWKNGDVVIDKATTETLALKDLPVGNYNVKCVLAAGDEVVESEVATIVVSAVPTPSPTPGGGSGGGGGGITPTPTPTIKPSPTPTVTPQPTDKPTPTEKPTEPIIPPVEPTQNIFEVIFTAIGQFFQNIIDWFINLFK